MGQVKVSGLFKRGSIWHVDKQINGKRIQCSTGTTELREAQEFLFHLVERERKIRVYGEPELHSFTEAANRYKEEETKKSLNRDVQDIDCVEPYIGHLNLNQVHMGALQTFINERRELGIKSSTINRAFASIRLVLKHAALVLRDQNGNPWLAHVPELTKLNWKDGRKPYPIDRFQESLLMKHLNAELRILTMWLINTGMRSQEMLNLRWSWRREVPELGCYVFDVPGEFTKNNNDRVVVMNRVTQQILDNRSCTGVDLVFANANGLKRDKVLTTNWKTARVRAADEFEALTGRVADWGFRNLRVHDLRHTFATRLRRSGVSLEVRKDLLSHVNSDVTTHYSAGELAELIEAVERLVESDKLPPTTPVNKGKVLQFPYNGNKESSRKVAK